VHELSAASLSAACATMIWCGANALGLRASVSGRVRKKVTWKPSGGRLRGSSQPVMYHHSVRNAGWLPSSSGKRMR